MLSKSLIATEASETSRGLIESAGVKVARYQPNTNPKAFTNQAEVMAAVRAGSTAGRFRSPS
jgi:hypothetical protein